MSLAQDVLLDHVPRHACRARCRSAADSARSNHRQSQGWRKLFAPICALMGSLWQNAAAEEAVANFEKDIQNWAKSHPDSERKRLAQSAELQLAAWIDVQNYFDCCGYNSTNSTIDPTATASTCLQRPPPPVRNLQGARSLPLSHRLAKISCWPKRRRLRRFLAVLSRVHSLHSPSHCLLSSSVLDVRTGSGDCFPSICLTVLFNRSCFHCSAHAVCCAASGVTNQGCHRSSMNTPHSARRLNPRNYKCSRMCTWDGVGLLLAACSIVGLVAVAWIACLLPFGHVSGLVQTLMLSSERRKHTSATVSSSVT